MTIYVITNLVNKKQYVGKTQSLTAEGRFRQHIGAAKSDSTMVIHKAMRKYGIENFIVEVLDTANDAEELKLKECEWISKLNTFGQGYNFTPGGDGDGFKHSDETKQKLRESRISYFENNPEARIKAAEYAKMAVLSEEGRTAKSESMQGNQHAKGMTYKHTEEAKANIAAAVRIRQLGTTASPETKLKMSESHKGSRNSMASEENRKKVGLSKIGRKKMYRDDGSGYYGYPEKEPLNAN